MSFQSDCAIEDMGKEIDDLMDKLHQLCWSLVLAGQSDTGVWSPPLIGEVWRRKAALGAIEILDDHTWRTP